MTIEKRLWVAQLPPSFNEVGFTGDRRKLTRITKEWKGLIATLCMAEGVPKGCSHIDVAITLTFPVRRDRDEENYRVVISKALGDALQDKHGGYGALKNDTSKEFRIISVTLEHEPGVSMTVLDLTCTQ